VWPVPVEQMGWAREALRQSAASDSVLVLVLVLVLESDSVLELESESQTGAPRRR